MMKPLLLASLFAFAAPQEADAGDFKFRIGVRNGKVRVGLGYRDHDRRDQRKIVRHRHRDHCEKVFVRGHYDLVTRKVWVPGHRDRVWHEAEYGYRYDACGRRVRTIIEPGHWDYVDHPGHYETRTVKVWHPGKWVYRCGHKHHRH